MTRRYNLNQLVCIVADVYGIPAVDMYRKSRQWKLVETRFIAMWFMVKHFNMTLTEAGAEFMKDHATAIYAIRRVDELRQLYPDFAHRFEQVANLVRAIDTERGYITKEDVLVNCTSTGMTVRNVLDAMEIYAGQFRGDDT